MTVIPVPRDCGGFSKARVEAQPRPDSERQGNHGQGKLELECPFDGFVTECDHGQQASWPSADGCEQQERAFRSPPATPARAPFVESKRQKCHHVSNGEPREHDGVE